MAVNHLISLQENVPTYGADGDRVTGHVTIKSPGLIKCYIQNLKKPQGKWEYVLCLMSKSKDRGVKIGNIGDEKETRWLVNQNNINGSGLKLDDIDSVAIVMDAKNKAPETVLLGFVKDRYQVYHIIDNLFPREKAMDKLTPITNKEKKAFTDNINNKIQKEIDKEIMKSEETAPVAVILNTQQENDDELELKPEIKSMNDDNLYGKQDMVQDTQLDEQGEVQAGTKLDEQEDMNSDIKQTIVDMLKDELNNKTDDKCRDNGEVEEVKNLGGFILPKDAEVIQIKQEEVKQSNTIEIDQDSIDLELKRIIDTISKDKRVEKKARELEEEILKLRHISSEEETISKVDGEVYPDNQDNIQRYDTTEKDINSHSDYNKDQEIQDIDEQYNITGIEEVPYTKVENEKVYVSSHELYNCNICASYTGQKLNIEEATEDNKVNDIITPPSSPHDALYYIQNMEKVPEEAAVNEADAELKYLRKMDDKLKQIRSRIKQGIEELDNNIEWK